MRWLGLASPETAESHPALTHYTSAF